MESLNLKQTVKLAFERGDYEQAIAPLDAACTAHPEQLEWVWYLGAALVLTGEIEQGQAVWFAGIAELDPAEIDAATAELFGVLGDLANRQHDAGYLHAATHLYEAMLELAGDSAEIHLNLGNLYAERGRYDDAIAHWQATTQLEPTLTAADLARATLHQTLGEWDAAIASYHAVLAHQPDEAIAHYSLGLCYIQQGQFDQAIAHFNAALAQQPNSSQILGDLAYALLGAGEVEAALSRLQQLSTHEMVTVYQQADPDLTLDRTRLISTLGAAAGLLPLGRSLWAAQNGPVARKVAEAAIAHFPDHPEAQTLMAMVTTQPSAPPSTPPKDGVAAPRDAVLTNESGVFCVPIHPPSVVTLRSPKTLDDSIHVSFRFDGAVPLPGSFVATLPHGRFWLAPDQSSCAVLTEDNTLLSDLSPEFPILSPGFCPDQPHSARLAKTLTPYEPITGTVAVLAGVSNDVYFHWLCDNLPRSELLHQSGLAWQDVDFVLVGDRQPFQRELLQRLRIPPEKVLSLHAHPHIQASRLIVPSFAGTVAWMSQAACDGVRQLMQSNPRFSRREAMPASDFPKRLYLSRQATPNRRILNGAAVEDLLHQRGFVSLTLEGYSVQDQADLLANADIVVAPHGSGLTNLLFCQPNTRVIELFAPNYVYPCYWYLANLVGLDYYYLVGQQPEGVHLHRLLYPHPRIEDLWVNLPQLSAILDLANVT